MFLEVATVTIGKRVRERRRKFGWSIRQLSTKADIAHSYLSDLERGQRDAPTAPVLERLADALDCSVDYLLGRTDTPKPPMPDGVDLTKVRKEDVLIAASRSDDKHDVDPRDDEELWQIIEQAVLERRRRHYGKQMDDAEKDKDKE